MQQGKLEWSPAFLDGTIVSAKGGRGRRGNQTGQGQQADAGHRWARHADRGLCAQCPARRDSPGGGDVEDSAGAASTGAALDTPRTTAS
jgi:hypothetical protein